MRLNRINSAIDRNERNKINENFDIIERGQSSIQTQLNTIVIEGDSSVEAAQARVSANDTVYDTLKARLDDENEKINQQLAQKGVDITSLGAVGNDVTKDTAAIVEAFQNYNSIFVPSGTFLVNQTLKLRSNMRIHGVGTLKFVGSGDFIVGDALVDSDTSFNFAIIEGIKLIGDKSLGVPQTGLNINGFRSKLKGITINNFSSIGLNVGGVCLEFEDLSIGANGIGCNIKDLDNIPRHSTMFNFVNCNFNYNDLGMTNLDNGQALSENIIHLKIDNCVFEKNIKHFKLRPFDAIMTNPWLEAATVASETWDYKWTIQHLRVNAGDPGIVYLPVERAYTGSVRLGNNGDIKAKFHDFSYYNNNGSDIGQLRLQEEWSDIGDEHYLQLTNKNTSKNTLLPETYSKYYRIMRPVVIDSDGTIMRDAWSNGGNTITVTRPRTGVYVIELGSGNDIMPLIEAMSPTSTGDPTSYTVPTYYHTTRAMNDASNSFYNQNNLTKKIIIHTFARTTNETGQITDTVADARINLFLLTSKR